MKVRYWLVVYPYQMGGGANAKPYVSSSPLEGSGGGKTLTFEVDVPDDLFGTVEIHASPLESA